MKELFGEYISILYHNVPPCLYEGLLSVFCLGVVLLVAWKGIKTGLHYTAVLLLIEYVSLLFCSTVVFRMTGETRRYDFHPFRSYKVILEGKEELLLQNIMNVLVFVPVGILLGSLLRGNGAWWKAILIGLGISVSIEVLQFILHRGFSEVDDVMHNTLGCMIGYGMYRLMVLKFRIRSTSL